MKKKRSFVRITFIASVCVLFVLNKDIAAESLISSARMCLYSLVPSLFPFMIAADLLIEGSEEGRGGSINIQLLLGWLLGFPIAAKSASQRYADGKISYGRFRMMVCCGSIPSLPFTIGVCGKHFGTENGIALYLITLLSAIACIPFFDIKQESNMSPKSRNTTSFAEALSSAISTCTMRMLSVCGYVCFFSMLSAVLTDGIDSPLLRCAIHGMLEFSGGADRCGELGTVGFILCTAILSFSGLSVYMQIISIQGCANIKAQNDYLTCKIFQAILSTLAACGYIFRERDAGKLILCATSLIFLYQFFRISQLIYRKRLKKNKSSNII